MNGVERFAWLRKVFTKLPCHPHGEAFAQADASHPVTSAELDNLLPDRWLKSHPQHNWTIDTIRRKKRQANEKVTAKNADANTRSSRNAHAGRTFLRFAA